jgi:hypothetical protein
MKQLDKTQLLLLDEMYRSEAYKLHLKIIRQYMKSEIRKMYIKPLDGKRYPSREIGCMSGMNKMLKYAKDIQDKIQIQLQALDKKPKVRGSMFR